MSDKLESWVEKKLEQGVEPDRLRESLENTGKDPAVVDKVLGKKQEPNKEENQSNETENKSKERQLDLSPSKKQDNKKEKDHEEKVTGTAKNIESRVKNTEIPFKPLALLTVLIVAVGAVFLIDGDSMEIENPISNPLTSDWDEERENCEDIEAGLIINTAEQTEEGVETEIEVIREEEEVVVELFEQDERTGYEVQTVEGLETVTIKETGDRVVLRATGCERPRTSQAI